MVDDQHFVSGMAALAGAFGREIDGPITRLYFNVLGPQLTNEEWTLAVERTVATERFWPSPAVLMDKVKATGDTAFGMVVDALNRHGGYRFLPSEISLGWDLATWAGIREVGGLAELTNCEGDRKWEKLKRAFTAAYTLALEAPKALPANSTPDPRVRSLVASTSKQLSLPVHSHAARDRALPPSDR